MRKLGAIEAQREWLGRWCFAMTGARPSLRKLGDRDVALLYQAITRNGGLFENQNICTAQGPLKSFRNS